MKLILPIALSAVALVTGVTLAARGTDNIRLKFDNTAICVPKQYVPGLGPFGQWIEENVSGLDDSGQEEIIRLPARLIMSGVEGYKFSHINKHNVDLEHEISGIAHNLSNVGNPHNELPCNDKFDLGYCYQSVVYKDVFYQFTIQTVERENIPSVKSYLLSLFAEWEANCG